MKKSVVVLGVVVAAGVGGLLYANHQAEKIIEEQIMLANQSYQEMAAEGLMPPLKLGYESLSANVLTRSFTITGLDIGLAEMGGVFRIEKLKVEGLDLYGLPDEGGMTFEGAGVGNALLVMVPPGELSELIKSIKLSGDYNYRYTPENGSLFFTQETRINNEFSISYNMTLSSLQDVWQYVDEVNRLPVDEKNRITASEEYLQTFGEKLASAAINSGELVIKNQGFVERVFTATHAAHASPSMAEMQEVLVDNIQFSEQGPKAITEPLIAFIENPQQFHVTFKLQEPLTFGQMQEGAASSRFDTPEKLLENAGLQLKANGSNL